jgi:hypothetical protein
LPKKIIHMTGCAIIISHMYLLRNSFNTSRLYKAYSWAIIA